MAQIKGDLILILVTLAAAFGWLCSQQILLEAAPMQFMAIRFILAGGLLGLILYPQLAAMNRQQWLTAISLGLFFAIAMLAWVKGLSMSKHLGESAFICSLAVVFVPVAGRIVYGTKFPLFMLWPLLLAVLGLAALALDGDIHFEPSQLYLLLSAVILSGQFVMTAKHSTLMPPMALAAIQMFMVGSVCAVLAVFTEGVEFTWSESTWQWLWASIVIASLLRFALQNYAFKHTSANNAGMIMILEPMWTALLGAAYLEETLEPNQWVGCTLIFAAILVYQMIRFFLWRKLVNPPATENLESVG